MEAQTATVAVLVAKEVTFQAQIASLSEQIGYLKGKQETSVKKAKD